jgi:hypothetical protein
VRPICRGRLRLHAAANPVSGPGGCSTRRVHLIPRGRAGEQAGKQREARRCARIRRCGAAASGGTFSARDLGEGPWTHWRVRHDLVDSSGKVTLRHNGRLHHIGLGRTQARTPIVLLVADLDIHVIHATTGELLRHLTFDPTRDYQPTGRPPRPHPKTTTALPPMRVQAVRQLLRDHIGGGDGIRTHDFFDATEAL